MRNLDFRMKPLGLVSLKDSRNWVILMLIACVDLNMLKSRIVFEVSDTVPCIW